MNIVDTVIAFENGELNREQVVSLFQELLDTGAIWHLQGSYQRLLLELIAEGLIVESPRS